MTLREKITNGSPLNYDDIMAINAALDAATLLAEAGELILRQYDRLMGEGTDETIFDDAISFLAKTKGHG